MKILLFGGSGQLGDEIMTRARDLNFQILSPVQSELNITEREQVIRLAENARPEIIMNCAAYTAVDKAEEERDAAFALNRDGAHNAALAAKACGARLVHISTDYVFGPSATAGGFGPSAIERPGSTVRDSERGFVVADGNARARFSPIPESAPTDPLNVYGESKLAGERLVLECLGAKALVVRTSSLHGRRGSNFVHTMLKLFQERDKVQVVDDQFMCPTWAGWLAETLLDLCRIECSGVLHASGRGVCSWFEFASAIYGDMLHAKRRDVVLEPVPASQFPRPAQRPQYSAMSTEKLAAVLGREPMSWREGLRRHLREIDMLEPNDAE